MTEEPDNLELPFDATQPIPPYAQPPAEPPLQVTPPPLVLPPPLIPYPPPSHLRFKPADPATGNYFLRHWRGDLSLGVAYWVNGGLITGLALVFLNAAANWMSNGDSPVSLRVLSACCCAILLFSVLLWLWSVVGIWRSADQHVDRGGSAFWAGTARVMVSLGALSMIVRLFTSMVPQFVEFSQIAVGRDPIGSLTVELSSDGRSAVLTGTLREGSAARLKTLLDTSPGIVQLVLQSNGGRMVEARKIVRMVLARKLDTYVEGQCASACTYVLIAGKDRAATPDAHIGFHQPGFVGLNMLTQSLLTQSMLQDYREAGLPEDFIRHIGETAHADMWYPTQRELLDAHVITRVSLGGEARTIGLTGTTRQDLLEALKREALWQALERRFPGTIEKSLDRGWTVKTQGGTDEQVMTAMRRGIYDLYDTILKSAGDDTLDKFQTLMLEELRGARAVSGEACGKFLKSQLDISKTLPPEIGEHDRQWMLQALNAPPRQGPGAPPPALFRGAMQKARTKLPQEVLDIVSKAKAYDSQPGRVCDAMISFYQAIADLPTADRHIALRGMFSGKD